MPDTELSVTKDCQCTVIWMDGLTSDIGGPSHAIPNM